jgi:predicted SprT family Zn-dependent metalloprotease
MSRRLAAPSARRGVVHPGWGGSLGPQHRQQDGTVAVWVSQPLMGFSGSTWMQRLLPSTLVSEMNVITDLRKCPRLIQSWTRKWNATAITEHVECEWSSRLRRSLGLAYPERMLVRLSLLLKEPKYASLFDEVLCHEVAHIAVFHVHGKAATSHGPEWKELLRMVGYEPRRSYRTDSLPERKGHESISYDHICPICQAKRTARRPMPSWCCVACQNAGLDGEMIIQSRPNKREALNV